MNDDYGIFGILKVKEIYFYVIYYDRKLLLLLVVLNSLRIIHCWFLKRSKIWLLVYMLLISLIRFYLCIIIIVWWVGEFGVRVRGTYNLNSSFQCGFKLFLMTDVVCFMPSKSTSQYGSLFLLTPPPSNKPLASQTKWCFQYINDTSQ